MREPFRIGIAIRSVAQSEYVKQFGSGEYTARDARAALPNRPTLSIRKATTWTTTTQK
jgi:hypothetical protein